VSGEGRKGDSGGAGTDDRDKNRWKGDGGKAWNQTFVLRSRPFEAYYQVGCVSLLAAAALTAASTAAAGAVLFATNGGGGGGGGVGVDVPTHVVSLLALVFLS